MSERKRSFWSSLPGFVTGLAGLLTAIVGLVTVLIQLDVIGGDDGDDAGTTTTTTVAGGAQGTTGGGTAGGGSGSPTTSAPRFTVSPTTLDFKPADPREKQLTVRNTSDSATLSLSAPQISGTDRGQFSATLGACSAPLRPGLSCQMNVTFSPSGPLRTYTAILQLTAPGARGEEVRLTASTLLG